MVPEGTSLPATVPVDVFTAAVDTYASRRRLDMQALARQQSRRRSWGARRAARIRGPRWVATRSGGGSSVISTPGTVTRHAPEMCKLLEGAMAAITQRTVTGRHTVALFNGAYHGINDEVIVRAGKNGRSLPAAAGIPPGAVENAT